MTWVRGTPPKASFRNLLVRCERWRLHALFEDRIRTSEIVHVWLSCVALQARARHSACLLGLNYCIFGAFFALPFFRPCHHEQQSNFFLRKFSGGTDGNNYLNDIVLLDTENMTCVALVCRFADAPTHPAVGVDEPACHCWQVGQTESDRSPAFASGGPCVCRDARSGPCHLSPNHKASWLDCIVVVAWGVAVLAFMVIIS